jgi:hypothetical protein
LSIVRESQRQLQEAVQNLNVMRQLARANAIRDAKTAVYPVLVAHYNDCTNSVRGQQLHAAVVAALESLIKKEGDDGPTK